jgi:aryl-alcohol dehydrogenase-like predicted oxidoreductase
MSFNQKTLQELVDSGVITAADVAKFEKRLARLDKKAAKEARAAEVLTRVGEAFHELTKEGMPTKHRAVWEKVGREAHSRDEVLDALRTLRDNGEARTYKLSNNNFQIFWAQPLPVVEEADEDADAEAPVAIPGVDEV